MINLLIADDHNMFINGLKMLLASEKKYKVTAIAHNGTEVLSQLRAFPIDIVLMDINMPVLSGYEAALVMEKQFPDVRIIALSMLADASSVRKMLEAGAHGYIFKNTDEKELFLALETVYDYGYFVTEEMQPVLKEYLKRKKDIEKGYEKPDVHPLSEREIEILKLIMEGLTNVLIAEKLYLSNRTVDTHRKNILAKLGLKNTAALVKYAVENAAFLSLNN